MDLLDLLEDIDYRLCFTFSDEELSVRFLEETQFGDALPLCNAVDERVKSTGDKLLQDVLEEIFRKCCSSNSTEIQTFVRNYGHISEEINRRILHRIIFRIRYPGIPDDPTLGVRSQIEGFYLISQQSTEVNPVLGLILELDRELRSWFPKDTLEQLSLLWITVLGRYYKSAELLVRSGADVNEPFGSHARGIDERLTVLHQLMQMNQTSENERLIRLITDHGADLQAQDSRGRTVLHHAVLKGRVELMEMLLEKGTAIVNIADIHFHETPLLLAAGSSNADELLPLLMKYGADVFVENCFGQNVLHLLSRNGERDEKHVELARALVEKGVSIDHGDRMNEYRPIHYAILAGHNELVKLYLDLGASVNWLVKDGDSPLHLAAKSGRPEVLKTLIRRGADIHHRTISKGHTALHAACEYSIRKNEKVIKLLLFAGADMLIEDCDGNTPIALMLRRHNMINPLANLDIVKLLAVIKGRLQPSIELKDERIVEQYPNLWDHYRVCIEQVERAKSTRLVQTCTLFDLIAKCHCQIAASMRNLEFEKKYKLHDLSEFPTYAEDIECTFESAKKYYDAELELEDLIIEVTNDIFPDLIVRKITGLVINCC